MQNNLTSQDINRLAQDDFPYLRDRFLRILILSREDNKLRASERLQKKISDLSRILKVTGLPLSAFEVDAEECTVNQGGPFVKLSPAGRNLYFDQLCVCMRLAPPDDALVFFRALADAVQGRPLTDCLGLMKEVLGQPGWCVQAIESKPEFFRTVKSGGKEKYSTGERRAANAFQVLGALGNVVDVSYEHARDVIRALKHIGLQDAPNPSAQENCLHIAAFHRHVGAFRAFLDEFPESIHVANAAGCTPLHLAACSAFPENVTLLLDSGVNPRPESTQSSTPLDYAAANNRFDSAVILLESGAYTESDVDTVCTTWARQADALKAYYAAMKARCSIDASSTADFGAKPL